MTTRSSALRAAGWMAAGAVAAVLITTAAPGASPVVGTAQAQVGAAATRTQVVISQRIAQAAVRRSTTARRRATRALNIAEPLPARLPRTAVVGGDGTLARGVGAVAAARIGFGRYTVTFAESVAACALSATVAVVSPGDTVLVDRLPTLGVDPADPRVVTVRIQVVSMPANAEDAPFHLVAHC